MTVAMTWFARCSLVAVVVLAALPAVVPQGSVSAEESKPQKLWVFLGTYTNGKSKGIYRCELDVATGKLSEPELAGESLSPSFLTIHPNGKFLYSVNESGNFAGKKTGAVSAFSIDPTTGKLTQLNQQPAGGTGPCHITIDKAGKHVFVANYGGGSCAALPIKEDGSLGEMTGFQQHKGSSVDKGRQEAPHAHSINLDPANKFAFVADLGLDKVLVYRFDSEKGTLTPNDPPAVEIAQGSGPRHFAFHPNGKNAYVINEMALTMDALNYDQEKGVLKCIQTISTLPKGTEKGKHMSTAEVVVHPSGKFVYGSNRGHNSIAIFSVDEKTGELTAVGNQAKGIKTPRNFNIDPTGTWLLVANQDGGDVIVFKIDQKTGELTPTEHSAQVANPVCVRFMAVPK
jgi:6-phosphogluconolactonase